MTESIIRMNTRIACDRDIKVMAQYGNYLAINIKKGEPFYPREVIKPYKNEGERVRVPAFADMYNEYPSEWFYEYHPDYISMHKAIFPEKER